MAFPQQNSLKRKKDRKEDDRNSLLAPFICLHMSVKQPALMEYKKLQNNNQPYFCLFLSRLKNDKNISWPKRLGRNSI